MRTIKRIVIWSVVILIVTGFAWRIWCAIAYKKTTPKYSVLGGGLDIKLIAIRPDMGQVCYDLRGNKIESFSFPLLPVDSNGPNGPIWD
jgi:hypothetical protein